MNNNFGKMKKIEKKSVKPIKNPVKSSIKHNLKFVHRYSVFNVDLSEILIFDDKKILTDAIDTKGIKIYDSKFNLIYKNSKHKITFVKIIDNDNLLLLNEKNELITLNIKENKSKILFTFKENFAKFLYINKNLLVTASEELKHGIKIWRGDETGSYQIVTVIKFPEQDETALSIIYYYEEKNLLVTNDTEYGKVNFFDFESFQTKDSLILKDDDELFEFDIFCPIKNDVIIFGLGDTLMLYDFKEKKILQVKLFKYCIGEVKYIKEKDIILISGGDHNYQQTDIYMYDSNFNELQIIPKVSFMGIHGFVYYDKNEKEKYVLVCSTSGEMIVYSIH